MTPEQIEKLTRVRELQERINAAAEEIGNILDEELTKNGSFDHHLADDLEKWIEALPPGCWYKVELMRAYRKKLTPDR
jgi:hypothetical protein